MCIVCEHLVADHIVVAILPGQNPLQLGRAKVMASTQIRICIHRSTHTLKYTPPNVMYVTGQSDWLTQRAIEMKCEAEAE